MCLQGKCQVHEMDGGHGGQYGLPQGIRSPLDLPQMLRRGRDPRMDMLNGLGGDLRGMGGGLSGLRGLNGGLPRGPRGLGQFEVGLPPGLGGGMGMGHDIMGQYHGMRGPGLLGRDPRLGGMRGEQFLPGMPAQRRGLGGMRGIPGLERLGGNLDPRFLPDLSERFNAMDLGEPRGYGYPRFQPFPGQYREEFQRPGDPCDREQVRDDHHHRVHFEDEEDQSRRPSHVIGEFDDEPDPIRRHFLFHHKKGMEWGAREAEVMRKAEEKEMKKRRAGGGLRRDD